MINIPSAQSMRTKTSTARANHAAEIIEANEKWFEAAIRIINKSAENGCVAADLPWPSDCISYADKTILLKKFQEAGYYIDDAYDSIANYCRVNWEVSHEENTTNNASLFLH